MNSEFFKEYNQLMNQALSSMNEDDLFTSAELIRSIKSTKNKIMVVGNGGSAAMASHVAVDLTKAAG